MNLAKESSSTKVQSMFLALDLFSKPVTLTFKRQQYHRTCIGVCLSIALVGFMCWVASVRLMMLRDGYIVSTMISEEYNAVNGFQLG